MTPNAPRGATSGLRSLTCSAALIAVATACVPALAAPVIDYPDFSDVSGLTINGNAAKVGSVLRVTPATFSQAGSAFSTNKVSLASGASFSTYFTFRFTSPGGSCDGIGCGADGIVFTVQTLANNVGGAGGGIGYSGIPNSLGVEFDTWLNPGPDMDSNHVGIDLNGNINSVAQIAITEADMNGGDVWSAWVDYNSAVDQLEVRLTRSAARPAAPLLSFTVDLATVLGSTDAFVGFTSGTGAAFANHDILSWQLNDNFNPINPASEPTSLSLLGIALLGFAAAWRRKT